MKGVGKENTTLETSNNDDDDVNFHAVYGGGEGCVDGGVHKGAFAEEEHSQFQEGRVDEPDVDDSKEEAVNGDDDEQDKEDEQQQQQQQQQDHTDRVAVAGLGNGPILGEDFYEVEAIRHKRVHKGQLQYLIKWLGWPEKSNTWEPLENLASVLDVVAVFEESLGSGKHRKLKNKHVVHQIQPKRRVERSVTPHNLNQFPANTPDNHTQSTPLHDLSIPDIPAFPHNVHFADEVENNSDASSLGITNHAYENRYVDAPEPVIQRNEETDYGSKVSGLNTTTTNGYQGQELAIHFQETQHLTGSHHVDGQLNGDCEESFQNGRLTGAKRRKSSNLKRFKNNSYRGCEHDNNERSVDMPIVMTEPTHTGAADTASQHCHKIADHARRA